MKLELTKMFNEESVYMFRRTILPVETIQASGCVPAERFVQIKQAGTYEPFRWNAMQG